MLYHSEEELRRAGRRKSIWNLILVPFCFGSSFLVFYLLFRTVWIFHTLIYPHHELQDFGHPGNDNIRILTPTLLMIFPLIPGAIGGGFYIGNILAWFIGPARRAFEKESIGHPGTEFRSGMKSLKKFVAWALPLGLSISLLSSIFLTRLK